MAILVNHDSRVIVQGITGREGGFHTSEMLAYGTQIVGGVTPGKGGEWFQGKPIFDTVQAAVKATGATCSVIFVPPENTADAIFESINGGIELIVTITEGMPVRDMLKVKRYLAHHPRKLIGPNSPGILVPGQCKVGITPGTIAMPGGVGVVSRSGTLSYELISLMTQEGIGQSTCVGIGGDPLVGMNFVTVLELFEHDPDTEQIVLIGEIGGHDELAAAEYIAKHITKPVVAFIAGRYAPVGKRVGHVGAMITTDRSKANHKIAALRAAGALVAETTEELIEALR